MGTEKIKLNKTPFNLIGDKIDPPLKLLYPKSQYYKQWCKANNISKKIHKKNNPSHYKEGLFL